MTGPSLHTLAALAQCYPEEPPHLVASRFAEIARLARHHRALCVSECNIADYPRDRRTRSQERIRERCAEWFPRTFARFSGDPRGATVLLVLPSGVTNDWGREGMVTEQ